ncbi:hypothetical protein [Vallicoccus soli]|uniref:Uncharacterized protein n=1 Tax=Vallicoccus soli TaxID=2339232 RepID=A0A3A3YWI7_9ACTN|nr:hypothetical protein [Vallicoccus soli]RJK93421.1 hypothetical protein D5H78_16490 [Vallicoccus soli]
MHDLPHPPRRRWSDRLDAVVAALLPSPRTPERVLDAERYAAHALARRERARRTGARVVAVRLDGGADPEALAARLRGAVRAGDLVAVLGDGAVEVLVEDQWADAEAVTARLERVARAGAAGHLGDAAPAG